MIRTFIIGGAFALAASGASAALIDFENEFPLNPDPTLIPVGNTYTNGSATFSSTETMKLVGIGSTPNTAGFVPNDTPGSTASGPASFGNVFLTGDFRGNTNMNISFASALSAISFEIVDIDGGNDNVVGDNQEEQFTFQALQGGSVVASQLITSRDLTGPLNEAGVVTVSFAGLFDEISIVGVTPGGSRNIGWGIDNINTVENNPAPNPVPLPAGAILMLTALGGFGVMRSRKRRS